MWNVTGTKEYMEGGLGLSTNVNVSEPSKYPVIMEAIALNIPCVRCDCEANGETNVVVLQLDHKVERPAHSNPDPYRTKLGVGEEVTLILDPSSETGTWKYEQPNLDGSSTSITTNNQKITFEAPYRATGEAKVRVKHKDYEEITVSFNVVEPTTYDVEEVNNFFSYQIGEPGAFMKLSVFLPPDDVSFHRVEAIEIPDVSKNATGYFADTNRFPNAKTNWWTHGTKEGAGQWYPVKSSRHLIIDPDDIKCGGTFFLPPPWHNPNPPPAYSGGSMTWPIQAGWRIKSALNNAPTNSIENWSDQHFTISSNGTVSISKFGYTVTRGTNEVGSGTVSKSP